MTGGLSWKKNPTDLKWEGELSAPTGGRGKNFICIHILILSLHTGAGTSRPGILIIVPLKQVLLVDVPLKLQLEPEYYGID